MSVYFDYAGVNSPSLIALAFESSSDSFTSLAMDGAPNTTQLDIFDSIIMGYTQRLFLIDYLTNALCNCTQMLGKPAKFLTFS
jgi:hypothetical protein